MNLGNEHLSDIAERLNQVAVSLGDMCESVDTDKALIFELLVDHVKDIAIEINQRGEGV